MTDLNLQARRRLLRMLSGAPLLPIGAVSATTLLTACGGGDDDDDPITTPTPTPPTTPTPEPTPGAKFTSARFIGMDAPSLADPAEMATTSVKSALEVMYDDGSKETFDLGYQQFFMTGDLVADGKGGKTLSGGYYDINNKPIIDASVPGKERQFFSDSPDGTSLLALKNANVAGVKGNTVFAVVQFEYTSKDLSGASAYGLLPSPIAVLTLDQDPETGALSLVKYHNVDTSSAHGLWITCGASLSPWGTHLSSEEYEPDAAAKTNAQLAGFSQHLYGNATTAKPYHYGHMPEVVVNPDGTGTIKKHYCMGRISHELVQVMPDQRTALMGDDATNGGLFLFVADRAADLSSGTLYVARWSQTDSTGAGAGTLTWIKLGHATSAEISKLADTLSAADIMDVATADPADASYTKIFYSGAANWVRFKPGMEKAAAFLETHRYAAYVGASMALTKNEGTTVNARDKVAYSALANIVDSMVKGGKGWSAESGIALDKKIQAGGILAHQLKGGQKATDGSAIDSEWVPVQSQGLLVGEDITADELGNTAHADRIASPDNLKFSEKLRTLFIGEDSGNHVNNFLWAYNVDTKSLTRILSTPAGAESTGLHAVDEINGWTYIMSNFQHPGDWTSLHSKIKTQLDPLIDANYKNKFGASVGYITGVNVRQKASS